MSIAQLPLPIAPQEALERIIRPALKLLPAGMTDDRALVLILSICMQESALRHRWQVVDLKRPDVMGPARGLSQFERGSKASRGGVWGVYLHPASRYWLSKVCEQLGVAFTPVEIWNALASNDALAVCLARLLLFTDPKPLPAVGDIEGAWRYYLRNWRPGAYTRGSAQARAKLRAKWQDNYAAARKALAA